MDRIQTYARLPNGCYMWRNHGVETGMEFRVFFPYYLTCFFFFSSVFVRSGQVEWCCPGLRQILRRCPPRTRVLCWLLPLPAFAARGQEVARVRAGEAEALARWCPSTWSPLGWAPRPWTFFVLPFFQITVGRNLNEILGVGVGSRGWGGRYRGIWVRAWSW